MRFSYLLLALAVCAQAQTPAPSGSSFPSSVPSGSPSFSENSELPSFEPTPFEDVAVSGQQSDPTACPAVRVGGCSVCGEGRCVTNPTAIFAFSGQPDVSCAILEDAGETGQVPIEQCLFLPGLVETLCGCASSLPAPPPTTAPVIPTSAPIDPTSAPVEPTAAPIAPSPAPVVITPAPVVITPAPVTPAPVGPIPCPAIPDGGCPVCGDGLCVTKFDQLFSFAGQPQVACSVLQTAGEVGQIPLNQCPFLPNFIVDLCGCESSIPAPPTAAPVAPTPAPVALTDAPVAPTLAPAELTDSPVELSAAPLMTPAPVQSTDAPINTDAPITSPSPISAGTASPSGSSFPSGSSLPSAEPSSAKGYGSKSKKSMKSPKKYGSRVAMSMIKTDDGLVRRRRISTRSIRGV